MAGICTAHSRKSGAGCDHRSVSVTLDGEAITFDVMEAELDVMPWTAKEKEQFIRLGLKYLRVRGLSLDNAIGRVTNGEEATNVKQYAILTRDVTKTNIGTAYVNIPPGLNGERSLIEFTGCTEYRIVLHANFVGTGPWNVRLVRDSDTAVIYESPNLTQTGERELDTGWLSIPAEASGLAIVRLQGKSAVGADDPIYRRCIVLVR